MVDASGKPWLDYPYAEDGLQLWGALDDYFKLYLPLYYGTDGDVLDDTELQAWWQEVKVGGLVNGRRAGAPSLIRLASCVGPNREERPGA